MKIYFDGCSWTKGEELENQEEERFSKLICNKLGAEETNLAIKGGSNDRIIRNLLVENNIEEYDLAVIQMTFPARTEYYTDRWVRVNPKHNFNEWIHGRGGDIMKLREKFGDHNDFWKYYYVNVVNNKYLNLKEKIQYEILKNSCKIPLVLCTINSRSKQGMSIDFPALKKHHYGHPTKEGHRLIARKILDKI